MSFLVWAGKLLPHLDKFDDLFEAGVEFASAPDSLGKWAAVKKGGDIAVPVFHDVTGLSFDSEEQLCNHVTTLRLGDGKLIERIKKFAESPFAQLLLQLILKQLVPTT